MKQLWVIGIFVLLATPLWGAGGDSSGGGSVVDTPAGPALLDFVLSPHWDATKERPGVRLPHTPFLEKMGVGWWDKDQSPVMQYLFERFRTWKPMGRGLVVTLAGVLTAKTQFFYTDQPLKRYRDYFLGETVELQGKERTIRTAILYDRLLGPVIYAPLWNQLSLSTQAGLLVHEALRYLQAVHPEAISEAQLQHLVATLLLTDPDPTATQLPFPERKAHSQWLESSTYLGPPLVETFGLPTWTQPLDLIEGVRFRLYYRFVQREFPTLFRLFEESPDPELEEQIRSLLPACGKNIHEAMEINCAAFFKSAFRDWKNKAKHPTHREQLQKMILEDGDMLHLWLLQGRPSPFISLFYDELFQKAYPSLDRRAIRAKTRDLSHFLEIRDALNNGALPGEGDRLHDSMNRISKALDRYLNHRVLEPPGP